MSYLHLIGKLNEARSNKALALASSKYILLDNPTAALQPALAKEHDEIRDLVALIDKAEHNQGSLTEIIEQGLKEQQPVFRKLKGVVAEGETGITKGSKLRIKKAAEAEAPPKKGLKLKVKSKFVHEKWGFPDYPYHKYFLPSFESMCGLLTREKRERDLHGMPDWNRNRVDGRLAVVTRTYPKDYMNADAITDLIVEPIRIRCRETKEGAVQKTQEETWLDIIKREKSFVNAEEAYERVYSETRGCNLFNITMGVYLLTGDKGNPVWAPVDGPGDVLDPASGWGDRLGAAFIAGARSYRGWDTNPALQETYSGLAKKYTENGLSLDWRVENAPFETAKLGDQKFDTVLTSPPFYNKELYEGKETSTTVYRNKKEWIDKYYHPMWRNAARALRAGGRVIAYISPGWMFEETDKVMKEMGLSYIGAVGFLQDTIGQPAGYIRDGYIWRLKENHTTATAPKLPVVVAEAQAVLASEPKEIADLRERVSRLKAACDGKSLIEGGYNLPQLAVLGTKFKAPKSTVKTRVQYEEFLKQYIPTLEAELAAALSKIEGIEEVEAELPMPSTAVIDFKNPPEGKFVSTANGVVYEYDGKQQTILSHVSMSHEAALTPLVTDAEVMSHIGTGSVWTPAKLKDFLRMGEDDWHAKPRALKDPLNKLDNTERSGFDWVIMNPEPVGVITVFTRDKKLPLGFELRVFMAANQQGKGLGSFALCAALHHFQTHVYSAELKRNAAIYKSYLEASVHKGNIPSMKMLEKVGFKYVKDSVIGRTDVAVYSYRLRNPDDSRNSYYSYDVITLSQLKHNDDSVKLYEHILSNADNRMHSLIDFKYARDNAIYDIIYEDSPKSTAGIYDLVARIRGRLKAEAISNKANLHKIVAKYGYDFIRDTYTFDVKAKPDFSKFDGMWIWRPSSGWSGHGVHIVTDKSQLQPLWEEFKKTAKSGDEVLLSRYIENPMLIGGYKFHIRMHLMVKLDGSVVNAVLINTGEIIRAKLPYRNADYENVEIHDTHMRYNTPLRFPEDFPETTVSTKKVLKDMQNILTKAVSAASGLKIKEWGIDPISVYREADGSKPVGFEIFGCDFMIDERGTVYLIEINKKPLFAHPHGTEERIVALSNVIFTTLGELLYPLPRPCFKVNKKYTYATNLDLNAFGDIPEPKPKSKGDEPKPKGLPFKLVPKAAEPAAATQIPKWNTVPAWRAFDISTLPKPTRPSSCKKTYFLVEEGYASHLDKYLALDKCEWVVEDHMDKVDLMIGSDAVLKQQIAADIRAELLAEALLDPTAIFHIIDGVTDKGCAQFNPVPSAVFEGRTDEPDYTRYKDENWVIRSSSEGRHPNISGKGSSELKEKWKGVGRIPVLLSMLPLFKGHQLIVSLPFILKLQNGKLNARLLSSGVINTQGKTLRFPEDMPAIEDSENLFKDVKQHASANEKGFSRTAHSIFDYMGYITRDVVSLSWDPMAVAMVGEKPLRADTEPSGGVATTAFDVFVIDFMISSIPKKLPPGYGSNDKVYFYGVRQNEQWSDDINELIARHVYDFVLGGNILKGPEVTNIDYITKDCKDFFED